MGCEARDDNVRMQSALRRRAAPVALILALGLLPGCADLRERISPQTSPTHQPETSVAAPVRTAPPPRADARTAEEFDTSSAEERREASAPARPRDTLGRTVASLGNPALPGFWAETPLVDAPRPGRLTDPTTGASVRVELRPSGGEPGSGTRVSLPAFRVLGVPLTELPELDVAGL